ncbi:MAG: sigma-70 family RNA polymerase sigma factor [Verrucomicrobiae bacterium]|nr:sigma-70 family RNA polymerase sigma factor [Verrucomicrobiae bacterium]
MNPAPPPSNPDEASFREPNEKELIRMSQQGDMEAYGMLVKTHHQKVFGLAMNILHNEADALDLAQETFIKAWKSLARFEGKSAFYTWLYRITSNLAIDRMRKNARHPHVDFDEVNLTAEDQEAPVNSHLMDSTHPSTGLQQGELRSQIMAALDQLSPEHRTVIVLKEYEDLDYREIARVMDCNIGTVMSRLFYARKNLKRLLKGIV